MKIKIFLIIFLFLVVNPIILFSAEGIPPDSEDLDSLRDPFTPQLPLPPGEETQKPVGQQKPSQRIASPTAQDTVIPQKTPMPIVEEPLKPPEIKISGLIWSTDRPQAIINDQIVEVGDQIKDWTIQKIDKDGVEISARGKKILIPTNLSVQNSSVKEPVNPKKQSSGRQI